MPKKYTGVQVLKIVKGALDGLFQEIDENNQEILRVLEEGLKKDAEKDDNDAED